MGQMNWVRCVQGAALFTASAIKYLHRHPDDLWYLFSYLWAPAGKSCALKLTPGRSLRV
jgi:hypothetical protein